jgi:uncharacterized protein YjbI with pentapeptide repeats
MTTIVNGHISSYGLSQSFLNGKKISDIAYDADYDGNMANIAARDGNDVFFMKLNNEDILTLLNNKTTKKNMCERLKQDLANPRKTNPRKTNLRKTNARKTNPRKTNPRKTNARKTNPRKTNPRKTNPRKTNLRKTNARKTNPRKTNLRKTNPRKTNLRKTNARIPTIDRKTIY